MTQISNDKDLRGKLKTLDAAQLRLVGAQFVRNVLEYCNDHRIVRALEVAGATDRSEEELEDAYKGARAATVESRTRCGADCNWDDQAAHFVARATAAVVAPKGKCKAPDPPWQVVMSCRMARNCALIAKDDESENAENETQYHILNDFMESQ
jgi:hypothetical protein